MRLLFVRTRSRVQSDVHQSVECWSSVNFTIAIYLTPRVRSKNRINADFQLVYISKHFQYKILWPLGQLDTLSPPVIIPKVVVPVKLRLPDLAPSALPLAFSVRIAVGLL